MMRFSRRKDRKKVDEKKLSQKEKKEVKEKQSDSQFAPLFATSMFFLSYDFF